MVQIKVVGNHSTHFIFNGSFSKIVPFMR